MFDFDDSNKVLNSLFSNIKVIIGEVSKISDRRFV